MQYRKRVICSVRQYLEMQNRQAYDESVLISNKLDRDNAKPDEVQKDLSQRSQGADQSSKKQRKCRRIVGPLIKS